MTIFFRKYTESDFETLVCCMEKLNDSVAATDPLGRSRRLSAFGERYTAKLITKISQNSGLILFACDRKKVVGCVAGIIERQTRDNLLECVPTRAGRVLELYVKLGYRNRSIGTQLMKRMEEYFIENECDVVKVEVFKPNRKAHKFYHQLDYQDRIVDLMKLLKH